MPRPRNSGWSKTNFVTVKIAAEMIGIAPNTLRRWIGEKKVSAYRVGGHSIRLDRDEVLALVQPVHVVQGRTA